MRRRKQVGQCSVQRVEKAPPTHAVFHDDGTTSIVYPEGHEPETLVRLPRGYSEATHEPDHAGRRFVRRAPVATKLTERKQS